MLKGLRGEADNGDKSVTVAELDNCDVCSGGNSGHTADSDIDECGECGGSGIPANSSIRARTDYRASSGFGIGDMTTVYAGREGYVLANPFQMNLEHGPDVDNDAVDFWNNWECHAGDAGPGTNAACLEHGANWLDPEVYVLAVAGPDECLTSWTYAADTEDTGDDSECLQWTITGWNHTILGGDIVGNSLVISPANAYRPFSAGEVVNTQEVFTGQMKTEFTAFNFEGEIGSGTVFTPVLLEDECDCDGNFADCNGDCGGSATDAGCGCGEAGPSGCDNTCEIGRASCRERV